MTLVFVCLIRLVEVALRCTCLSPAIQSGNCNRPCFEVSATAAKKLPENKVLENNRYCNSQHVFYAIQSLVFMLTLFYQLLCHNWSNFLSLNLFPQTPLFICAILRGKQHVHNSWSFLQCVNTVLLTSHNPLPYAYHAHGHVNIPSFSFHPLSSASLSPSPSSSRSASQLPLTFFLSFFVSSFFPLFLI